MYPSHLKREYIPQEIFDFFDKMYDPSISDTELFSEKQTFSIGECPGVVGYGGIHAAIPNYFFEETDERVIRNKDVASYYPHLMTLCGYTSRNIPSAQVFEEVLETRMKAKASGDKATANALLTNIDDKSNEFLQRLVAIHPKLTQGEKYLATLLRVNLSTKEISMLTGTTPKTINMNRYRLRKSLNLSSEEDLTDYLQNI